MPRYSVSGASGAASTANATSGIVEIANAATTLARPYIYEFGVYPGAAAEDSNYTFAVGSFTAAGTWTTTGTGIPNPLDPQYAAAKTVGGYAQTAQSTPNGLTELIYFGCNQRGGFRWVAVPGSELYVAAANNNGLAIKYKTIQGTASNYGTILFYE